MIIDKPKTQFKQNSTYRSKGGLSHPYLTTGLHSILEMYLDPKTKKREYTTLSIRFLFGLMPDPLALCSAGESVKGFSFRFRKCSFRRRAEI